MGLFSGSKKIFVSSTAYNLAGPEKDRPNYLKSTLFNTIMSDLPSTADGIRESYFNGPGMVQRHYFNWAKRNDLKGFPTAKVFNNSAIDGSEVQPFIPTGGATVVMQRSYVSIADPDPFIRRWLAQNAPETYATDWIGDYDPNTKTFSVQGGGGQFHSFTDSEYSSKSTYIIGEYYRVRDDSEGPDQPNGPDQGTWTGNFPDDIENATIITDNLVIDNDTTDVDGPVQVRSGTQVRQWQRLDSSDGAELYGTKITYNISFEDSIETNGSNQTFLSKSAVVTTTTNEVISNQLENGIETFIYEVGSGNPTLDALYQDNPYDAESDFYPILPLRIDNHSIRHPGYAPTFYDETKQAWRRLSDGKNIDEILDEVEDNDDIDDIDYAYVQMGCALNTKEATALRYIYEFFDSMRNMQNSNDTAISDFQSDLATYNSELVAYTDWLTLVGNAQSNSDWENIPPKPPVPNLKMPPSTTIQLTTNQIRNASDPDENGYDFRTSWVHIQNNGSHYGTHQIEDTLTGKTRNAKKGDGQIISGTPITWKRLDGADYKSAAVSYAMMEEIDEQMDVTYIRYWYEDDRYYELQVYGLVHENFVYGGKSVRITADWAINGRPEDGDVDADPDIGNGFIIPLNYPILRGMSIVDYTQIATANMHIVFNSYEVVKKKWYENFLVILIVMVVVIAVAAFVAPGLFASAGGFLGGNAAVGASLGLTGAAAVAAGAVANYLAAVVISQVVGAIATAVFGEKWGAVIAAVAMFAAGGGFSGGFSLGNILKFGNVLANAVGGYMQGEIAEDFEDLQDEAKRYEEEMRRIQELIDGLGGNDLNFDPLSLTNTAYGNDSDRSGSGLLPETMDEFIQRTLMVMSDVIEISHGMIENYVDVQLTLPEN